MKLKHCITVTKEDIKQGVPGDVKRCPVALALRRQLDCNVLVGSNGISIEYWDKVIKLPPLVREFIERFDTRLSYASFTFFLVLK